MFSCVAEKRLHDPIETPLNLLVDLLSCFSFPNLLCRQVVQQLANLICVAEGWAPPAMPSLSSIQQPQQGGQEFPAPLLQYK